MKTILLICQTFKNFTGSELVTVSQAEYFQKHNWNVHVFVLEYGNPLKEAYKNINVYTMSNADHLLYEYDLIIARQYPVLDYVLFTLRVKAKRVYYECVSYRIPIDAYPIYYKELTMIGAVSERVQNEMSKKGYDLQNVYRLPNYATKEYFDVKYECNKEINKIAIVSNHVQPELEEFKEYAENQGHLKVDIYGMHHTYKLVTPELLKQYDVIISIGKTVFYALAIGIPCYTYDELCTEGYITIQNYNKNLDNNMAYSLEFNKKNGKQIYTEIISEYKNVCQQTLKLKQMARNDFYFDHLMDGFLENINNKKEMNYPKLYEKYPTLEYSSRTYVEDITFFRNEVMKWYNKSLELGDLYQQEILKTVNALKNYEQAEANYEQVINSKGWKLLEMLRKIKFWREKR